MKQTEDQSEVIMSFMIDKNKNNLHYIILQQS